MAISALSMPPANPAYQRRESSSETADRTSVSSAIATEAKSVFKFGRNLALSAAGGALLTIFGFLKDVIPGVDTMSEKLANVGVMLGVGLLGWGIVGGYLDSRKARKTVEALAVPPQAEHTLPENLANQIADELHEVSRNTNPIFKIDSRIINHERVTADFQDYVSSLFNLWADPEIVSKLNLNKGQAEILFTNGAGSDNELSSSDLKDLQAVLAAYFVSTSDRDSLGDISITATATATTTPPPVLNDVLYNIELEAIENPNTPAPHRYLYSDEFIAVYSAARNYNKYLKDENSFVNAVIDTSATSPTTPDFTEVNNNLKSTTDKQQGRVKLESFKKHYNYLNILQESARFVLDAEKEFAGKNLAKLNKSQADKYRKSQVIKSALIVGLKLRAPSVVTPLPPESTALSINDQLTRILEGHADNTTNLLGSTAGIKTKFNEATVYQEKALSGVQDVQLTRVSLSEYRGLGALQELLPGSISLSEFEYKS